MDANEKEVRDHWKQIAFDGDPLYGYELRLGANVTELVSRYHQIRAGSEADLWHQAKLYTDALQAKISETEEEIEFLLDLPVSGEVMGRIIERSRAALKNLRAQML